MRGAAGSLALLLVIASSARAAAPTAGRAWSLPLDACATLAMAWIPPGSFWMGSVDAEPLRGADEGPRVHVTLSHGYWIGSTPVTIAAWRAIMGVDARGQLAKVLADDTLYAFGDRRRTVRDFMGMSREAGPDRYLLNEDDDLPAYFVSWTEATEFCRRLTARERAAGRLPVHLAYRLPTEAEWEYASRAGSQGPSYADTIDPGGKRAISLNDLAWYRANSGEGYAGRGWPIDGKLAGPRRVGTKLPNKWGLYDMLGNVWEWCRDWYGPYSGGTSRDPTGPLSGSLRVNRGGSFGSPAADQRSARRAGNPPDEASAFRGFRVVLAVVPTTTSTPEAPPPN